MEIAKKRMQEIESRKDTPAGKEKKYVSVERRTCSINSVSRVRWLQP